MATEILADYPATEQELYAIADLAYSNLTTDLVPFAAIKAKYTAAFVTGLRATRTTAMNLPNQEARDLAHELLHNQLVADYLPPVLDNFNVLKGYIKDAWPTENPAPRYQAAGGTLYPTARNKNWEDVVGLNTAMQQFITTNAAILAVPGGMTGTFVTKVNTDASNFSTKYSAFIVARETGVATAQKIAANNLLYKELVAVLEDGAERVFRNNEAKQQNYVFTTLKDIVSPPGSSSLTVTVKLANDTFVENAAVSIKQAGQAAIVVNTNASGIAFFPNINPGHYEGTVTFNLLVTPFTKDVDTGVDARITVVI